MLTVCNRTETAARVEHYFNKGDAHWPELHAPTDATVHSKVLDKAEIGETADADKATSRLGDRRGRCHTGTRKERLPALKKEELLREIVDNVGKRGMAVRTCGTYSVAMLSQRPAPRSCTHVVGQRAVTASCGRVNDQRPRGEVQGVAVGCRARDRCRSRAPPAPGRCKRTADYARCGGRESTRRPAVGQDALIAPRRRGPAVSVEQQRALCQGDSRRGRLVAVMLKAV